MIRIGIIGCGKIAQVRHLPEYAANPNAQVVAYHDKNRARAEEMAAASRAELDARRSEQEQALARARIARAVSRMHVKRDGK